MNTRESLTSEILPDALEEVILGVLFVFLKLRRKGPKGKTCRGLAVLNNLPIRVEGLFAISYLRGKNLKRAKKGGRREGRLHLTICLSASGDHTVSWGGRRPYRDEME